MCGATNDAGDIVAFVGSPFRYETMRVGVACGQALVIREV